MKATDLAWVAGIVDGEGCIHAHGTITLTVTMCDVESLWRMRRILGGVLTPWKKPKKNSRPFRTFHVSGRNALNAIEKLRPWLSSVKLADLEYARRIAPNAGKGANWFNREKIQCLHGHPFSGRNLFLYNGSHGPQRMCRTCRRNVNKAWYERNKHTKFWRKYR